MENFTFGRLQSEYDERDYDLNEYIPSGVFRLSPVTAKSWAFTSPPLDQENMPHCVGFSMANFGINEPLRTPYKNEDAHNFYYLCKEIDGRPRIEEGSTMRSAAKALRKLGKIESYAFARDLETIKWWLLNRGPIIVGTLWTEGMLRPDSSNIIKPTGTSLGGHAYLLNEWTSTGYIGIQNSWGKRWGINGKAYIHSDDFIKIFARGGEAITVVEVEKKGFFQSLFKR